MFHPNLRFALALVACAAAGCRAGEPPLAPPPVDGTYVLSSVTGTIGPVETPISGSLSLTASGQAVRELSYRPDSSGPVSTLFDVGSFTVSDSTVHLALQADSGHDSHVWTPSATIQPDGALRLAYPRAADGTIVEVYRR